MLNFLDGWSVGKVVPAVAVELGDSYSVGACIISRHSLVQLCGGDPSPLRGMNFTTRPREVRLEVMRCCGRLFVARSPRTPFLDNFRVADITGTSSDAACESPAR